MLIKEQPAIPAPRPKSFAALMEMYETNYLQLRVLCGDLRAYQKGVDYVSNLTGNIPVLLRIEETSPHTTTLLLTYQFSYKGEEVDRRPDMTIQVYHDARQAEVISHRCRLSDNLVKYWGKDLDTMLRCRWRMNRFLYKWTSYLRHQGHQFGWT